MSAVRGARYLASQLCLSCSISRTAVSSVWSWYGYMPTYDGIHHYKKTM